jgi:hypothetical protein
MRGLRRRIERLEAKLDRGPTFEEVLAAWGRVGERVRRKLRGEGLVDREEASRDEALLNRAGFTDDALQNDAERSRAKLRGLS